MHTDEIDLDARLVGRLVAQQFPWLSDLPISAVRSTGTVNAIFRIGDNLCARLPRVAAWAKDLDAEWRWLPQLAPRLSLQVPEPVVRGEPAEGYPCSWAIYRWLEGQPYADHLVDDEGRAARDLARFVLELRRVDRVAGAPRGGRPPLAEHDAETRVAIHAAREVIDSAATTAAWDRAVMAPTWHGPPVWLHGDLLRPNLLVRGGRISAVIDFGGVGVGDPAADVIPAWSVFGAAGREIFRNALDVDDGTWSRARGFALLQAVMIIPYYRETNPGFVDMATRTVDEVLADH